jgi:hypothetical protein
MDTVHDDRFMVFLRADRSHTQPPDTAERPLHTCATYEEARRIQRAYHNTSVECVIRYLGPAGGGD